jgi:hypothetical protein
VRTLDQFSIVCTLTGERTRSYLDDWLGFKLPKQFQKCSTCYASAFTTLSGIISSLPTVSKNESVPGDTTRWPKSCHAIIICHGRMRRFWDSEIPPYDFALFDISNRRSNLKITKWLAFNANANEHRKGGKIQRGTLCEHLPCLYLDCPDHGWSLMCLFSRRRTLKLRRCQHSINFRTLKLHILGSLLH